MTLPVHELVVIYSIIRTELTKILYIGEWEKTDFINQSSHEEYINYFKKLLDKKMLERIDDIETLIEDLGYDSVAYAFRCIYCNKITIVCQDY